MVVHNENGLRWYGFESFPAPVVHGTFTRLGGVSQAPFASLNLGGHVGDDPEAVAANHAAIYRALDVRPAQIVTARQVHGHRVAIVDGNDGAQTMPDTDALITDVPGLLLLMRFADCVPVFLYDPEHNAVGLAHAGWQGTLQSIAQETVRAMVDAYGSTPATLRAGLGPAIGPCCFEVGEDVIAPTRELFGADAESLLREPHGDKAYLDLWLANERQLQAMGVRQIETVDRCTCCHQDEFYSHRGENGRTGRFGAVLGLRGD